jgi:hypothetical protein
MIWSPAPRRNPNQFKSPPSHPPPVSSKPSPPFPRTNRWISGSNTHEMATHTGRMLKSSPTVARDEQRVSIEDGKERGETYLSFWSRRRYAIERCCIAVCSGICAGGLEWGGSTRTRWLCVCIFQLGSGEHEHMWGRRRGGTHRSSIG